MFLPIVPATLLNCVRVGGTVGVSCRTITPLCGRPTVQTQKQPIGQLIDSLYKHMFRFTPTCRACRVCTMDRNSWVLSRQLISWWVIGLAVVEGACCGTIRELVEVLLSSLGNPVIRPPRPLEVTVPALYQINTLETQVPSYRNVEMKDGSLSKQGDRERGRLERNAGERQ
eukprot:sb/3472170/